MKKIFLISAVLFACSSLFAFSYKNNVHQKLAEEYAKKARVALEAGQYDVAVECTKEAEKNALLSQKIVKTALAEIECDEIMKKADVRMAYAKSIKADEKYPETYNSAEKSYILAKSNYEKKDYLAAVDNANKVIETLANLEANEKLAKETESNSASSEKITESKNDVVASDEKKSEGKLNLPKYYIVRPWADFGDCYGSIAGRSYVYNNSALWEKLYEANKSKMPNPNNPNLILPGMKMEIPSISGEYREGVYDPSKKYDTFKR